MYEMLGMSSREEEQLIIIGIAVAFSLLVNLVMYGVAAFILSTCFRAIPDEHRQMQPGMVWLLLIPCFPVIWNFFVFLKLSKSFKSYFAAQGVEDVDDCAEKIGLWFAICVIGGMIPCVQYIAGPAALVLLIIYLVKAVGLKKRIQGA